MFSLIYVTVNIKTVIL